jgi:hypothetical protein
MSKTIGLIIVPNGNIISYNADSYDDVIDSLWDNKDSWKYNEKTDREDYNRNFSIEKFRNQFCTKSRKYRKFQYGSDPYFYTSKYHKGLFLEIVTALGLAKESKPNQKLEYTAHYTDDGSLEVEKFTSREYDPLYKSNKSQENEL